jgi:uncharacterized protein (DUF302 family)
MLQEQLQEMLNSFGFCRRIDRTHAEAVAATIAALQAAGFEIITSVDMQPLTEDNHLHTILQVWDPVLARRVLQEEPALSMFLPFNVAVVGNGADASTVCMPDPIQLFQSLKSATMQEIARDLNGRLWGAYLHVVIKQPQPVS